MNSDVGKTRIAGCRPSRAAVPAGQFALTATTAAYDWLCD
jgi:hypothetical protein